MPQYARENSAVFPYEQKRNGCKSLLYQKNSVLLFLFFFGSSKFLKAKLELAFPPFWASFSPPTYRQISCYEHCSMWNKKSVACSSFASFSSFAIASASAFKTSCEYTKSVLKSRCYTKNLFFGLQILFFVLFILLLLLLHHGLGLVLYVFLPGLKD